MTVKKALHEEKRALYSLFSLTLYPTKCFKTSMASKILITGASGFIGSFIVEEALDRGMEVWAAVRRTS